MRGLFEVGGLIEHMRGILGQYGNDRSPEALRRHLSAPRSAAERGRGRAATKLRRRKRSVYADAPSTALRAVPLPRYRGGGKKDKRSRSRDGGPSEVCGTHGVRRRAGSRHAEVFQDRAVGPASARSRLAHVARMERSVIREQEKKEIKTRQAERRQTPPHQIRTIRVRRAPKCGARCAYRRSTAALAEANQRRRSAPAALPGT